MELPSLFETEFLTIDVLCNRDKLIAEFKSAQTPLPEYDISSIQDHL